MSEEEIIDIEVGEYVRDKDGFITKVNFIQYYEEDDDTWYEERTLKGTWKSMIVNHSKDIIDLIEVGDIVKTGVETIFMNVFETQENLDYFKELYKNDQDAIKSIVTKEQFEEMEYRVDE